MHTAEGHRDQVGTETEKTSDRQHGVVTPSLGLADIRTQAERRRTRLAVIDWTVPWARRVSVANRWRDRAGGNRELYINLARYVSDSQRT